MMKANLHLGFPGTCREAFEFYERVFGSPRLMTMTYGEAPGDSPVPEDSKDRIMHTALQVGNITLMGADSPKGHGEPVGGYHVCLESADQAELKRLFAALSEGGSVMMPLGPTFWSPLFAMLKDRYGVGWMLIAPGQQG
jgi:PhnB protein